jgi:NADPH-dependent curcumin reductase CurA
MTGWLKDGGSSTRKRFWTASSGRPRVLIGLFEGRNAGKMLIHIAD